MDPHVASINQTLPLTTFQILATFIFALSSLIALLAYCLVLIILFLYFRQFKSNFYYIVISLAAADISYLALILFYVVPCTILKRHIWAPYDYGAGLLECLAYISQCTHLVFIALNRLAYAWVTGPKKKLDKIFKHIFMITFWIVFLWLLSIGIAMPIKLIGCDLIYDYEALDFMRNCRNRISTSATNHATLADAIVSGLLPILVALLHVATWAIVFVKGRHPRPTHRAGIQNENEQQFAQTKRREKRILIQFSLISTMLLLFYTSFWVIPETLPGSAGAFVVTLFGIVSSGINPFTYLAFNKVMKLKAKYLICVKLLRRKPNAISMTGPA